MWGRWGLYMLYRLANPNPKPKSQMGVVETKWYALNTNVVFLYWYATNTIYYLPILNCMQYLTLYYALPNIIVCNEYYKRGLDRWCNPPLTPTYPHNLHLMLKNFTRYNPYYQYNLQNRV